MSDREPFWDAVNRLRTLALTKPMCPECGTRGFHRVECPIAPFDEGDVDRAVARRHMIEAARDRWRE